MVGQPRLLRFNTHFVEKDGVFKNNDGNFFWNPANSSLAPGYMDARNSITRGPMKTEGDNFQVSSHGMNFDLYNWLLQEKQPDAWHQLAKLNYIRQPGD